MVLPLGHETNREQSRSLPRDFSRSRVNLRVIFRMFTGVGRPVGVDGLHGGRLLELVHLAGFGLDAGQFDDHV